MVIDCTFSRGSKVSMDVIGLDQGSLLLEAIYQLEIWHMAYVYHMIFTSWKRICQNKFAQINI